MGDVNFDQLLIQLSTASEENAPPWAIIMMQCFKSLLILLQGDFNKNYDTQIQQLKQDKNELKNEIDLLKLKIDDQEQRSRNSCLLVHGIKESNGENTDALVEEVINDSLGIQLSDIDIQRSHRLGPKRNDSDRPNTRSQNSRPRPIIFRFGNLKKRNEVYYAKKKLKGKGIVITENLTKTRYTLFKATIEKLGQASTWTKDGRILAKIGSTIKQICSIDDLGDDN